MTQIIIRALAAVLIVIGTFIWFGLLLSAMTISSDPMGEGLAYGFAFIATLLFCGLTVPAGFLVYSGRLLPLALILAIIPLLAAIFLL